MELIELFENSFRSGRGSCTGICQCGKEYFSSDIGSLLDDENEINKLRKSKTAIEIGTDIIWIEFEGKNYAHCCDCWEERAKTIYGFLVSHRHQIAKFLNAVKKSEMETAASFEEIN